MRFYGAWGRTGALSWCRKPRTLRPPGNAPPCPTPHDHLRTEILDFRGFDSSRILSLSRGIVMSMGNLPESLSQAILAVRLLVGRLGVLQCMDMYICIYVHTCVYIYIYIYTYTHSELFIQIISQEIGRTQTSAAPLRYARTTPHNPFSSSNNRSNNNNSSGNNNDNNDNNSNNNINNNGSSNTITPSASNSLVRSHRHPTTHVMNLLGWLGTRLAQNTLNYIKLHYITLKHANT